MDSFRKWLNLNENYHPTILQIAKAVDKGKEAYALADALEEFGTSSEDLKLADYIRKGGYSHGRSAAAHILQRDFNKGDRIHTIHGEGIYDGNDGDNHFVFPLDDNVKSRNAYVYNKNDFSHHATGHLRR